MEKFPVSGISFQWNYGITHKIFYRNVCHRWAGFDCFFQTCYLLHFSVAFSIYESLFNKTYILVKLFIPFTSLSRLFCVWDIMWNTMRAMRDKKHMISIHSEAMCLFTQKNFANVVYVLFTLHNIGHVTNVYIISVFTYLP